MGKNFKVVVTDFEYHDLHFEEEVFKGYPIDLIPAQCRSEKEVIRICQDADGIINQYAPINEEVIASLNKCQIIARYGIGVNTIDIKAATEKLICVANVPDYCIDEVSNHALTLLLAGTRKITAANQSTKAGHWDFKNVQPIHRLNGQVLGLIGFGRIPQLLAEKAKPLGLHILAYDPFVSKEAAQSKGVQLVSLEELCERSDFISVHAPLNSSTQGMIAEKEFALMKRDTLIINTSRGPLINENALIKVLQTGKIAGACLDVTEEEPINSNNPLLTMEQVILTPHMAWYSEEAERELRMKAAMSLIDVLVYKEFPKYLLNNELKGKIALENNTNSERYALLSK
ncbi:MAG: C-terminal binding protein [Sporolactobacillus sp.]